MNGTPAPVLAAEGLRFRWPGADADTLVIDRFTLAAGERLLLRGPSGCGKSTLLSLAAGVLLPSAGRVALLGRSWADDRAAARDRRRAEHVGVVFQQFNLLPYLPLLENVLLPCRFSRRRAARAGADEAARRQAAERLLDALQLAPSLWGRSADRLSVGQQQRVAVARALIGAPELVIADEPTSALDAGRRDAFLDLLGRECRAAGSALLFVSHDPGLAPHFDRVLELPALNRAAADPAEAA